MERNQTHLLGIYNNTNALALSKRKLLRSVAVTDPPPLPQEEQRAASTKLLLWLGKLAGELKRALQEFAAEQEDPCLQHLAGIAQGLKCRPPYAGTTGNCSRRRKQ